ncbi:hypothetical protein F4860DRAFT_411732 [Xylaria cubensis]|nr:hypothetical protein F4860DRAFT_411732 [Xylaria cubensis]
MLQRAIPQLCQWCLVALGVKVSREMQTTSARLLENPEIAFATNAKHNPGMTGRWDLRGKRFLEPNQKPMPGVGTFASKFTQTYRNHGADLNCLLLSRLGEATFRWS